MTRADSSTPARRLPTLSFTLQALIVGLLVLTVAAIVLVGRVTQTRSLEDMQSRLNRAATVAVGTRLTGLFDPAVWFLDEAATQARLGRLETQDFDALGRYLAAELRYLRTLSLVSYAEQPSGRLVAAWRGPDGAIILTRAEPAAAGGAVSEFVVAPDGQLTPFERPDRPQVNPLGQSWVRQALATDRIVWSEPYPIGGSVMGLGAARAARLEGAPEPSGAFAAQFFLDDLDRFLAAYTRARTQVRTLYIAVVTRSGNLVASSEPGGQGAGDALLDAAAAALPGGLGSLQPNQNVSLTVPVQGEDYAASAQLYPVTVGLELVPILMAPLDELLEAVHANQRIALGLGLLLLLLGTILGTLLANRIGRPLRTLAADLERVGRFDLSTDAPPRTFVREMVVVSDAAERMKASLRSFARYVPRQLVRDVLASGEEARLGGQHRELTISFSDIEGFTRISEAMTPSDLVEHLGEYLQAMTGIVEQHQGTVDKFMGDGIMALFNAPLEVPDHAAQACRAALCAQQRLEELGERWRATGKPVLRTRLGLHTGAAIVGNIGTPERFEYTVMGDTVNLASRLEGLNKLYGTYLMGSEAVREAAGDGFEWRTLDRVAVVGREGGTLVSELLGVRDEVEVDSGALQARDVYEAGLESYFARRFHEAAEQFLAAAAARPNDLAARMMAGRAEELSAAPPPPDWDGVYRATAK